MDKIKIVCILGQTCSGKTYLYKKLKELKDFKYVVETTTRPMRIGETNAVDYIFTNIEEFKKMIKNKEIITYKIFNDWFYGLESCEFSNEKINLLITNPFTFSKLQDFYGKENVIGFYLDTPLTVRFSRYVVREGGLNKEIFRRLKSDRKDFKNIIKRTNMVRLTEYKNCSGNIDIILNKIGELL